MKHTTKKVLAIILAVAAILSFAACGKNASDDTAHTSETAHTPEATTVVETTTIDADPNYIDFNRLDSEVQKDLLKRISRERSEVFYSQQGIGIERSYRSFYIKTSNPYTSTYLGSVDVPADNNGWDWSGEHYVFTSEDGSYILNDEGKLQYWRELTLVWEIKVPTDSEHSLRIVNNDNDVVVIEDTRNHVLYIAYDKSIKKLGEDVYDVDAQYRDLWWMNIEGEVYFLEDYGQNPQRKAELMATDAIALSKNMSDGPGWYVTGDASYVNDWSPVIGEFVPAP